MKPYAVIQAYATPELRAEVAALAKAEHRSVSSLVQHVLAEKIEERKANGQRA